MLLHYLKRFKNQKFCTFHAREICFSVTFCHLSFTVLNKLKALQLSQVGLSTIKHQHSKNLTRWTEAT